MNVSNREAREALADIQQVADGTRRLLVGRFGGLQLVWWGALCALAYVATYALVLRQQYREIGWVWWAVTAVGWIGTGVTIRRHPVRVAGGWKIGAFWGVLALYANVWLALLRPWNGIQLNLFIITLCMFAYVTIGIFAWRVMAWVGLAGTALILAGYFVFDAGRDPHLWLWLAFCLGATLIGPGCALLLKSRASA
jgi:hypothetical protein